MRFRRRLLRKWEYNRLPATGYRCSLQLAWYCNSYSLPGFFIYPKSFVHFFCLPKRNEPKKRAAANELQFWRLRIAYRLPHNTTRSPALRRDRSNSIAYLRPYSFAASKMSLFFQKRFGGTARLTAIWF